MAGIDEQYIDGVDLSDISFDSDEESTGDEPIETEPEEVVAEEAESELSEDDPEDNVEMEGAEDGAEPVVYEWDGNPDNLPPALEYEGVLYDLSKPFKSMLAGNTKRAQADAESRRQVEELRKVYEERLAAMEKDDDPEPQYPTEDMTAEQQREAFIAHQRWVTRQELADGRAKGTVADPRALDEQRLMVEADRRLTWLRGQEDWKEMEAEAKQIVSTDTFWNQQVKTDEGTRAFYEFMKRGLAAKRAAGLEKQNVRRKARAGKKATPKGTSRKAAPADTFAESLEELRKLSPEERISRIVDEEFGG